MGKCGPESALRLWDRADIKILDRHFLAHVFRTGEVRRTAKNGAQGIVVFHVLRKRVGTTAADSEIHRMRVNHHTSLMRLFLQKSSKNLCGNCFSKSNGFRHLSCSWSNWERGRHPCRRPRSLLQFQENPEFLKNSTRASVAHVSIPASTQQGQESQTTEQCHGRLRNDRQAERAGVLHKAPLIHPL